MSLITRCPECGTMFNVVTDQLKVSQGWVRCGQCTVVFDASLHMQIAALAVPPQDMQDLSASERPKGQAEFSNQHSPELLPQLPTEVEPEPPLQIEPEPAFEPQLESDSDSDSEPPWLPDALWSDRPMDEGLARDVSPEPLDDNPLLQADPLDAKFEPSAQPVPTVLAPEPDFFASKRPEDAYANVSFVRDAERQAFWRRPLTRLVLSFLCLLLTALLLMQIALQQKDYLAARYPFSKPWLQQLCKPFGCQISAFRQIESVVIDSSSFSKLGTQAYRLSFSLKNIDSIPLAMPFVEVTLTDSQDRAVLRRVLAPTQFGAVNELLPGSNFPASLVLRLDTDPEPATDVTAASSPESASVALSARVAGYHLLAFYP
ncbi:hypothetical protein HC248_02794 [Polaromonas vacuolata]|uniref:Zinc finger/thioredoxin putative domain-containing protein n=1 Tax=Polaromonas vacuolata TaxID=37448 RepID=A0A6H2HC63_9BURK|nr:DUF3426 domain-containing protein [Polaromonas vacuolata]QJC57465.1 hypothetical protein HC248_02794 [Polaromonas vacuolata]